VAKRETLPDIRKRALEIHKRLDDLYPDVKTFLTHESPFQLLIAVILSAQCTDARVNLVTPFLFKKYPTIAALANAPVQDIKDTIHSINFFNNKANNIKKTANILLKQFRNRVPRTLEDLTSLPGVGRKTANVVLGQAFDIPGITVDTHVKRVTTRLGFTAQTDPVKIEFDLMKIWPKHTWNTYSTTLILHGRNICKAQRPWCSKCKLYYLCPRVGLRRQTQLPSR